MDKELNTLQITGKGVISTFSKNALCMRFQLDRTETDFDYLIRKSELDKEVKKATGQNISNLAAAKYIYGDIWATASITVYKNRDMSLDCKIMDGELDFYGEVPLRKSERDEIYAYADRIQLECTGKSIQQTFAEYEAKKKKQHLIME
jgi:hypothetical protein